MWSAAQASIPPSASTLGRLTGTQQGRQDSNLQPPVLETGALPVELLPWVAREWYRAPGNIPSVHRRALGLLFSILAAGLGIVAVFSALEGGRAWVIALAAAALALWMASLARRALGRRA
jgi:hypothetical protein